MSNTPTEPNYDNTGASEGARKNFVEVKAKEFSFKMPDGKLYPSFSGYLQHINMEWREAIPKEELPDRWHIYLVIKAKDGEEIKDFHMQLSSHWGNPIMKNIVNGIYGELHADGGSWQTKNNRFIRVGLYKKEPVGGRAYCTSVAYRSNTAKDFLHSAFPFDETTGRTSGIPEDKEKEAEFWLVICRKLVEMTGGVCIGEDKHPIPGFKKTATPPSQPPATLAPPPALDDNETKYLTALSKKLDKKAAGPDTDTRCSQATAVYKELIGDEKAAPTGWGLTDEWLRTEICAWLTAMAGQPVIYNPAKEVFLTKAADEDDLPF